MRPIALDAAGAAGAARARSRRGRHPLRPGGGDRPSTRCGCSASTAARCRARPTSRRGARGRACPCRGWSGARSYTVRWRATSSDGHTISGVYTFGVGVDAPPPTEAVGASGLTWRDDVARWAPVRRGVGARGRARVPARRPPHRRAPGGRVADAPRHHGGGVRRDRRRDRRPRAPQPERAAAPARRPPLRRPHAVRDEDPVRDRVDGDDHGVRGVRRRCCCSPGRSTACGCAGRRSSSASCC